MHGSVALCQLIAFAVFAGLFNSNYPQNFPVNAVPIYLMGGFGLAVTCFVLTTAAGIIYFVKFNEVAKAVPEAAAAAALQQGMAAETAAGAAYTGADEAAPKWASAVPVNAGAYAAPPPGTEPMSDVRL